MVYATLTIELPLIVPLVDVVAVQVAPDGQEIVEVYVVETSPALFITTVYVEVPDVVIELEERLDDTLNEAGDKTDKPLCVVADKDEPVPLSVAETDTVILFV